MYTGVDANTGVRTYSVASALKYMGVRDPNISVVFGESYDPSNQGPVEKVRWM